MPGSGHHNIQHSCHRGRLNDGDDKPPNSDESSFLHQLYGQVEEELAEDESAMPAEDAGGISTEEWQLDPYPRYEVGFRALLGAGEGREDDSVSNDLATQDGLIIVLMWRVCISMCRPLHP
jgi:hypothetical protein